MISETHTENGMRKKKLINDLIINKDLGYDHHDIKTLCIIPAYVLILTSGSVKACMDYSIRITIRKKILIKFQCFPAPFYKQVKKSLECLNAIK